MLKGFTQEDWVKEVRKIRPLFFNEEPKVIEIICNVYKYEAKYLIYFVKKKPIFTFIAYTTGAKIVRPIHFFYSAFWFNTKFSEAAYINNLTVFISELKGCYNSISISLPIDIKDVRPFIWSDFSIKNRFTYIKSVNDLRYEKDARQNVSSDKQHFCFKSEELSGDILKLNLQLFYNLKVYPQHKISQIKDLFVGMANKGFLRCYSAYDNGQLIASHILFFDIVDKKVYAVVRNKVALQFNINELHSKLYHNLFLHLREEGYQAIDLLGGNILNVSLFKSRFRPELATHFVVSYSKNAATLKKIKQQSVLFLKSIVSKFY